MRGLVLLLSILAAPALAQDHVDLLRLTYLSDGVVTEEVRVTGTAIDPNRRSVEDRFALVVGDTTLPDASLAADLAAARRMFSYDALSGGITSSERLALCQMAGPATGWVLEVRYLTYADNQITGDAMRPVYAKPGNCLFRPIVRPKDPQAALEAAEMLGQLRAILALSR